MLREAEAQYADLRKLLDEAGARIQYLRGTDGRQDRMDGQNDRRRRVMDDRPEAPAAKGRPDSRMSDRSEQSVQEPVTLSSCGQFWEEASIEGLLFESIPKHDNRLAERARQSISQSRKITTFDGTHPELLQVFLEDVVEEINHFSAQPQDWAKLLLYHVSPTIRQGIKLEVPRPHNVSAVVQYLRRAYPLRGAMSSLRTRMFRKLEQGTNSVTEFYNRLMAFARENPTIYTPRELR